MLQPDEDLKGRIREWVAAQRSTRAAALQQP
jgi:hypothetical protein